MLQTNLGCPLMNNACLYLELEFLKLNHYLAFEFFIHKASQDNTI